MARLRDLEISPTRRLSARWLRVRSARSRGPGGQNVNKVETKVDLRLDLGAAASQPSGLSEAELGRLRTKLATRIDSRDVLRVTCDMHRTRTRNLATALERMETLIRKAIVQPRKRKPTRRSRASVERRLDTKRRRSSVKQRRSRPKADD